MGGKVVNPRETNQNGTDTLRVCNTEIWYTMRVVVEKPHPRFRAGVSRPLSNSGITGLHSNRRV